MTTAETLEFKETAAGLQASNIRYLFVISFRQGDIVLTVYNRKRLERISEQLFSTYEVAIEHANMIAKS